MRSDSTVSQPRRGRTSCRIPALRRRQPLAGGGGCRMRVSSARSNHAGRQHAGDSGGRADNQVVSVALPRFKVETGTSLNDLLKALGMTSALPKASPTSRGWMARRPLIWEVMPQGLHRRAKEAPRPQLHGCGHERRRQRPSGPQLVLTADRPFLYFLRDKPHRPPSFHGPRA